MRRLLRKEDGILIDELGSILVMAFMIIMILVYASYGRMVQMRLAVDNVARNYLYLMEEKGTLTYSDALALEAELQALGCTSVSFNGTSNMGNDQAAYGESITLNVSVIFPNPLYRNVSAEVKGNGSAYTFDEYGRPVNPDGTLFTMTGLSQNISYIKTYSSVSKW